MENSLTMRNDTKEIINSILKGNSKLDKERIIGNASKKENLSKINNDSISGIYIEDLSRNDAFLEVGANVPVFSKDKECDYSCISYLTSRKKPDIYIGNDVIKAKQYKVKVQTSLDQVNDSIGNYQNTLIVNNMNDISIKSEIPTREISQIVERVDKEGNAIIPDYHPTTSSTSDMEEVKENYENLKKKDMRYFTTSNITIKCYNCEEVGHMSRNCPNEIVLTCLKCNQKGHEEFECPYVKCFKCNKIGHKSNECKVLSKDILKCQNCLNVGHVEDDCLIFPKIIRKKHLEDVICAFCKKAHYICPLKSNHYVIEEYNSDNVEISETEEGECQSGAEEGNTTFFNQDRNQISDPLFKNTQKKRKRIFNKLDNSQIRETVFCPKCGEMHSISDCSIELKINSFDKIRKVYSQNLFKEDKEEKKLKKKKKKYYDENVTSDESFTKILNEQIKKFKKSEKYYTKNDNWDNENDFNNEDYRFKKKNKMKYSFSKGYSKKDEINPIFNDRGKKFPNKNDQNVNRKNKYNKNFESSNYFDSKNDMMFNKFKK